MRHSFVKLPAIAVGLMLSGGTASAAIISGTYTVTGSNFASGTVSPFATVTESFAISFDNTITVSEQTANISLNASTITPTSTLAFTYIALTDTLIVGGLAATVGTADANSPDFALTIANASNLTNLGTATLSYSVGNGTTFGARNADAVEVPEPTAFALLGTAAATIALVRRRRRN